jgi:FkbM family methyltransferase
VAGHRAPVTPLRIIREERFDPKYRLTRISTISCRPPASIEMRVIPGRSSSHTFRFDSSRAGGYDSRVKRLIRASVQTSLDRRSLLHRAERWASRHGLLPIGLWYFSRIDGRFPVATPGGATVVYEAVKDDLIAPWLYWRGWIMGERAELQLFSQLVGEAKHVVDVGAYTGYYTLVAAAENPALRVTAFEPVPANYERLMANLVANGSYDRVEALCAAVSSTSELVRLGMPPEERMPSSGRLKSSVISQEPSLVYIDVPTVTLDKVLAGVDVDVVKVDVEGAEGDVVAGAAGVLSRCAPTLLMECFPSPKTNAADPLLRELGYSFFRILPDGPMRVDRLGKPGLWSNYLCVARPQVVSMLAR